MSDDPTFATKTGRLLDDPRLVELLAAARREFPGPRGLRKLGLDAASTADLVGPRKRIQPTSVEDERSLDLTADAFAVDTETMKLRWVVASDEAGFTLKARVIKLLAALGADVSDLGPVLSTSVDYPDYALAVARALLCGAAERGILVCGHGVGASVAASKMRGVRAGLCRDWSLIRDGVEKDDMNVLVLPASVIKPRDLGRLVRTFFAARFGGAARHRRCLTKIRSIEELAARDSGPES